MQKTCRALTTSKGGLTLALSLVLVACGSGADNQTTSAGPTVAPAGIFADVDVPDDHRSLLPGKNGLELSTTMSVDDLTTFFEDEMPGKGWRLKATRRPEDGLSGDVLRARRPAGHCPHPSPTRAR